MKVATKNAAVAADLVAAVATTKNQVATVVAAVAQAAAAVTVVAATAVAVVATTGVINQLIHLFIKDPLLSTAGDFYFEPQRTESTEFHREKTTNTLFALCSLCSLWFKTFAFILIFIEMEKQTTSFRSFITSFFGSVVPSFQLLRRNDPLVLAGATAFFTTFALPPIVFLLARLFGFFFTPKLIGSGLLEHLSNNFGPEGAQQVRQVIRSIRGFSDSWYVTIFGSLFLFFVATTLFLVIKNSIHQLWQFKPKEGAHFVADILSRLKSFAVILLVGLLFLANLLLKSIESFSGNFFESLMSGSSFYFKLIFSEVSSIVIVSAWFVILFRFITDARPHWKAAITGGILTGILFSIGRYILRLLLVEGNVGQLYGTSGSFVLVLLFVFYTSFILYYGAAFVAVYSKQKGWKLDWNKPPSKLNS